MSFRNVIIYLFLIVMAVSSCIPYHKVRDVRAGKTSVKLSIPDAGNYDETPDIDGRRMKTLKLPDKSSPPAGHDVTRNVTRKEGKKVSQHKG